MNLPNQLTLGRLGLTVLFVAVLESPLPFAKTIAIALFVTAGATDYLDGELARRWGMVTDFGRLMDPLMDKIMMVAGFICLIPYQAVPPWVAVVVISREFLITGLRLLALTKGQILSAEKLGKHKTAWQVITVAYFLLLMALRDFYTPPEAWESYAWDYGGTALLAITVILTLWSGLGYLWKNRAVLAMQGVS